MNTKLRGILESAGIFIVVPIGLAVTAQLNSLVMGGSFDTHSLIVAAASGTAAAVTYMLGFLRALPIVPNP